MECEVKVMKKPNKSKTNKIVKEKQKKVEIKQENSFFLFFILHSKE